MLIPTDPTSSVFGKFVGQCLCFSLSLEMNVVVTLPFQFPTDLLRFSGILLPNFFPFSSLSLPKSPFDICEMFSGIEKTFTTDNSDFFRISPGQKVKDEAAKKSWTFQSEA